MCPLGNTTTQDCSTDFFQQQVPIYAAYLYDAIMVYAKAVTQILREGKSYDNGTAVVEWIQNRSHTSMLNFVREKGRDLTQSYDKSPCTDRKIKKAQRDNTKTPPKTSITQRLRTDLRRSVGVTIATQLVLLNRFTGSQPSH